MSQPNKRQHICLVILLRQSKEEPRRNEEKTEEREEEKSEGETKRDNKHRNRGWTPILLSHLILLVLCRTKGKPG